MLSFTFASKKALKSGMVEQEQNGVKAPKNITLK